MTKKTALMPIIFCLALLLLNACGTSNKRTSENKELDIIEPVTLSFIQHIVESGDNLANISLKYTGKSTNWKEIAQINAIENPQYLHIGQRIEIPSTLIPNYTETASYVLTENQVRSNSSAVPNSTALAFKRPTTAPSNVIVTPDTTNRAFDLEPYSSTPDSQMTAASGYSSDSRNIKVLGTYYPKGIYDKPAAYSTLMQRAAPGSIFTLDRQVNDWYKIILNNGTGYIRTSDAELVE